MGDDCRPVAMMGDDTGWIAMTDADSEDVLGGLSRADRLSCRA